MLSVPTIVQAEQITETKSIASEINKQVLSEEEENRLRAWFSDYDVSEDVQSKLIEKLKNGEIWDAINENESYISITEGKNSDENYKVATYKDGSITVTTIENMEDKTEQVENVRSTSKISGGRIVSRSPYHIHYADVKVSADSGLSSCSFLAEYVINNGYDDELLSVYDSNIKVIGGTFDNETLSVLKAKEDYRGPAKGELSYKWETYGPIVSNKARLQILVGNDSATAVVNSSM